MDRTRGRPAGRARLTGRPRNDGAATLRRVVLAGEHVDYLVGVPLGVVMVSVCRADEDRRRGIWGLWIGVGMLVVLALAYLVLALW